jgi:hypothetical protein
MKKECGKNIYKKRRWKRKEKKPMTKVTNDQNKSRKVNYQDKDLLPTINTWISTVDNFCHVSLD